MAIAGSMQNCVRVWVHDGKPAIGASQRADKSKIAVTPEQAAEQALAGQEYVYLLLYGDNVGAFQTAVAAKLGRPVFK